MVRVLQIIGSLNMGGAENFLMNLYRSIDRGRVQFDFAVYDQAQRGSFYDEVGAMGGKVFYIPGKSSGIMKNMIAIKRIVEEQGYKIVWRHTESWVGALDLVAAKYGGAEKLVLHSHNTKVEGMEKILHYILRPFISPVITNRFACGLMAGRWMYGKEDFRIIHNGIDISKYRYDDKVRNEYRDNFEVANKLVLGHIGRFAEEKNHIFLLDLLCYMLKHNQNIVLMLVGEGELKKKIEHAAEEKGLMDHVRFLGVRNDVEKLLQMFDVLVFPSLFEGVPVTLVEAQTSDLPCVVSDNVSAEVQLLNVARFLNLSESLEEWEKNIIALSKHKRTDVTAVIAEQGYDIKQTAETIQGFLEEKAC